jgi:stress response protein YsnF
MPENRLPNEPTPFTIPLAEETAEAHITEREQGVVRITKRVEALPVHAPVEVRTDRVTVKRVPRNEVVAAAREPWQEDDTLVIPVYEERIVTELVLVEEVHVRTKPEYASVDLKETVRKEVVEIETLPNE